MSRPISWLPRVRELHRSAVNSVRSHYSRRDLQSFFEMQARSVQKLFELMPRTAIGSAMIVERDDLVAFLSRVRESDNVPKLFEQIRLEKPPIKRQKIRSQLSVTPRVDGTSLPDGVYLRRGKLEVSFRTPEQLAEALLAIAKIIETDEFAEAYGNALHAPAKAAERDPGDEIRAMFAALDGHQTDTTAYSNLDASVYAASGILSRIPPSPPDIPE